MYPATVLKMERNRTESQPPSERLVTATVKLGDSSGRSVAVPISPAHMVTEAEPYLWTSGLARTENVA